MVLSKIAKKTLLSLISAYQSFISPLFPPSCRFFPSCSHYAYDAISRHGHLRGSLLSLRRFLKCHPFHKQKTPIYDPVPKK